MKHFILFCEEFNTLNKKLKIKRKKDGKWQIVKTEWVDYEEGTITEPTLMQTHEEWVDHGDLFKDLYDKLSEYYNPGHTKYLEAHLKDMREITNKLLENN